MGLNLLSSLDGSFPVLGAPQTAAIDHEAKMAAATAVKQLAEVTAVTGAACQHVHLLEILSVKRQVHIFCHVYGAVAVTTVPVRYCTF
jgi:hypothetical protein